MAGDAAGAATHITHFATPPPRCGEAVEPFAVEWLVQELIEDSPRVFLGEPVVPLANRLRFKRSFMSARSLHR